MTPVEVVQQQLNAYNAHDLPGFMATYSEEIQVFHPPALQPTMSGKAALAAFYASQRFNLVDLHAEIVNRIVLGNKVIDHERVSGIQPTPVEVVAVYEVSEGLIQKVWFFAPK